MIDTQNVLLTLIAAAIPGVVIALLAHQLDLRRDQQQEKRIGQNARTLLKLETNANRNALQQFWTTINALDVPDKRTSANDHLSGMVERGMLGYPLPEWYFAHWERLTPQSLAAFTPAELGAVDSLNRSLRGISDLYTQIITLTPQENEQLNRDRFWPNRFADWRNGQFARLATDVDRALHTTPLV